MMQKTCPNCHNQFEGRRNKKFCSVSCKNQYHNEEYRSTNKAVFNVNKVLTKNRAILRELYTVYRSSPVATNILKAHGFNLKFHTHVFNAPSGEKYTMIYEIGYKHTIDDQIQIVEMEDEIISLN